MGRKVILSRKGFDGTTGGKASPIIDGKLISLPIPRAESGDFYKDLILSETESYFKIMYDLGIKLFSEAHVDPDIKESMLPNRSEQWRGLFGQSGSSQGTLANKGVEKEDIFLFFGWFREVMNDKGIWKYRPNAPDIHAIYGFLEVDQVIDIQAKANIPEWMNYHPHIRHRKEYIQRNAVYVAKEQFSKFPSKRGWGCFNSDDRLVLTKKGATNKTIWQLPSCFEGEMGNFNSGIKRDVNENEHIVMQLIGRGDQEVFISDKPEVLAWAEDLISTCSIYE